MPLSYRGLRESFVVIVRCAASVAANAGGVGIGYTPQAELHPEALRFADSIPQAEVFKYGLTS